MKLNWKLLETASENANHCQRNWDRNTRISKDVRDSLINIATNLPTKQNQAYYHLLVSDNPAYNKKIYECTIDKKNIEGTQHRNSQVDSPLLFLYLQNNYKKNNFNYFGTEKKDDISVQKSIHNFNVNLSVGISSGAVVLAANQMGMRTGFCCCYDKDLLVEYFSSIGYKLNSNIITMLGIGYPNKNFNSNVVLKDNNNEELRTIEQYNKKVTYTLL